MSQSLIALPLALALGAAAQPPSHAIDHIGIGSADLHRGIVWVAERTGVTAQIGGVHPGRGTQNALLSLGSGTYLEIISPVPGGKPVGEGARIAALTTPEPVFFAVRSTDLEATAQILRAEGFATTPPRPGSRKRPGGSMLKWRSMGLEGRGLAAAPFFIEWDKASPHPSSTSPAGCTLKALEVSDKDPERLRKLFSVLGLAIPTNPGPAPSLRVTLSCPAGEVTFGQ